jgi:saccharopine dehydrogenase (NAD+, L-lysine-forming)
MIGAFAVYGANGYTGALVVREAVARGLVPIVAGRRRAPVEALARAHGLPFRVFDLADRDAAARGLEGVAALLLCAGPFVHTSRPMVDACLAAGVHYLDITGEIEVFEAIFARDAEARTRGVVLLPGVGFDVVPSDGLARRLAEALPDAVRLDLAFAPEGGSWSRGTLATSIEGAGKGGAMRRGGRLRPLRTGSLTREIEFVPGRPRLSVAIPWGDLATAWRTTGIPDITTWLGAGRRRAVWMRRLGAIEPLLRLAPVRKLLRALVRATVDGPDAATRDSARVRLWGRAEAADGRAVEARLEIPEGYRFTASAAVECLRRVAAGEVPPGAWTPSRALGAGFVEGLPGVVGGAVTPAPPGTS